ncbi:MULTISPECIES: CRISPR-associated endoribonuclease Cas6 [Pseudanabaena]|uniref:CRISPR-associated protein, Cas6 family n=2 Tax=Pseudanabaena TaxID=1152 RepID=L8MYM2_9CYAN|nr:MULTISPECIES: CRISPR-associated endoribonuclease Cas6 [Pseudanabaena]ELS33107.1 CRISPR-associated protein, Cas6 family [Pseudanabaena biceps PCC 7429]MDG3494667.1 CRISPR-associated endoribonuclease Cas6 [Pseudanabaena catenata USMAC16]
MPHSLVVNFMPKTPIYPEYLTGRHIHALFLTLVSSVDKELGDRLHGEKANKGFGLSPIVVMGNGSLVMGNRSSVIGKPKPKRTSQSPITNHQSQNHQLPITNYQSPIPPSTPCWWRISLLDEVLFGKLTGLWLNLNPDRAFHLGSADLYITGILGTPQSRQPWANFATYQQIYDRASETERNITFHLATPTAFRQGKYDSPLPTRDNVFKSLCDRWNTYSEIPINPEIIEYIFPSRFDIKTEVVKNYDTHSFIGCIGEIGYRILGDASPETIKQINALADFAMFAGIGRKTTMGMGMVRRVIGNW